MYCKNCGTLNDDNSKFCVNCGQSLKPDNTQFFHSTESKPHPEQHLFQLDTHDTGKSDTGFLIIAILTIANLAVWFIWTQTAKNSFSGNQSLYKIIRIFSVLFLMGQFIVSAICTKKEVHRTIIIIIGLLCSAYYLYYLVEDLKKF
jgi:hypothetical protein